MVYDDMNHPRPGDTANGSAIQEGPEDNILRVLTWSGYSSGEGEYYAHLSRWAIGENKKELILVQIVRKQPYSPWDEGMILSLARCPDNHRRLARAWARQHWHMQRFHSLSVA